MGDTEIDDHDLHDDHDDHGELDNHDLHDDHDDHEDEHDDHHDHDLETFKIIMLFAMIACCAFGIVPKVWGACQRSENVIFVELLLFRPVLGNVFDPHDARSSRDLRWVGQT